MRRIDALAVLGLGPSAGSSDIRAAFRRLVHERHPDTGRSSPREVHEVIEAYRFLTNDTTGSGAGAPVPPNCFRCEGSGRIEMVERCGACGGDGWITGIDVSGAFRARCRPCHGRGRRRSASTCDECSGSGQAS